MKFILGLFIIGVIATGLFLRQKGNQVPETKMEEKSIVATQMPSVKVSQTQGSVPLPTEEDIIRVFFELINEKRIPAAIDMMDKKLVGDDAARQAWGVQFNSLKSIVVKKIEPSMKEEWTLQKETFKVNVNIEVSKEAANAPIPNYGWENGDNLRWITLEKNENNIWKVSAIATGP